MDAASFDKPGYFVRHSPTNNIGVLLRILDEESGRAIDKAWMAMLAPLGIEKGTPFNADERQRAILRKGAAMGELMARNLQVNPRFAEPYWAGTSWYKSYDFSLAQETESRVELDERTTWFPSANSGRSRSAARTPAGPATTAEVTSAAPTSTTHCRTCATTATTVGSSISASTRPCNPSSTNRSASPISR